MKRLSKGFTLAEVLITLTIIGVVARVTLPALMANVSSQSTATTLSKAINTLEVGNQRMLTETSSTSLSGATDVSPITAESYVEALENYSNGFLKTSANIEVEGEDASGVTTYTTKDGIMFASVPAKIVGGLSNLNKQGDVESDPNLHTLAKTRVTPPKYSGRSFWLLVDINGTGAPNRLAKDQFIVAIDDFGQVIPYGGAEFSRYALTGYPPKSTAKAATTPAPEWETRCAAGDTPSSITARAACTGSIVDNGYKVVYAF